MYNSAARLHNALVGLGWGSVGGAALNKYGSDIGNAILSNVQDTPANAATIDTPSSTPPSTPSDTTDVPLKVPQFFTENNNPSPSYKKPTFTTVTGYPTTDSRTLETAPISGPYIPTNQYGYSRTSPRSSWVERKGGVNNGHTIAEDHNNPLNETIRGRTKNGGRGDFKVYNSLEDGIRGNWGLLQRYQDKHNLNTMSGIAARWSGLSGDKLKSYVNTVAKYSGLDPNAKLDVHDPQTAAKLMYGMAVMESSDNAKRNLSIDKIYSVMSGSMPESTRQASSAISQPLPDSPLSSRTNTASQRIPATDTPISERILNSLMSNPDNSTSRMLQNILSNGFVVTDWTKPLG